jgi:hypothetical protein
MVVGLMWAQSSGYLFESTKLGGGLWAYCNDALPFEDLSGRLVKG